MKILGSTVVCFATARIAALLALGNTEIKGYTSDTEYIVLTLLLSALVVFLGVRIAKAFQWSRAKFLSNPRWALILWLPVLGLYSGALGMVWLALTVMVIGPFDVSYMFNKYWLPEGWIIGCFVASLLLIILEQRSYLRA